MSGPRFGLIVLKIRIFKIGTNLKITSLKILYPDMNIIFRKIGLELALKI